jgi:hypothetical protein
LLYALGGASSTITPLQSTVWRQRYTVVIVDLAARRSTWTSLGPDNAFLSGTLHYIPHSTWDFTALLLIHQLLITT